MCADRHGVARSVGERCDPRQGQFAFETVLADVPVARRHRCVGAVAAHHVGGGAAGAHARGDMPIDAAETGVRHRLGVRRHGFAQRFAVRFTLQIALRFALDRR